MKNMLVLLCILLSSFSFASERDNRRALLTLRLMESRVLSGELDLLSKEEKADFFTALIEARMILLNQKPFEREFYCKYVDSNHYVVADLDTQQGIGEKIFTEQSCKDVLPLKGAQFACVHNGSNQYIVADLRRGDKLLGEEVFTYGSCTEVLPVNNQRYGCIHQGSNQFEPFDLKKMVSLGNHIFTFRSCIDSLPTEK